MFSVVGEKPDRLIFKGGEVFGIESEGKFELVGGKVDYGLSKVLDVGYGSLIYGFLTPKDAAMTKVDRFTRATLQKYKDVKTAAGRVPFPVPPNPFMDPNVNKDNIRSWTCPLHWWILLKVKKTLMEPEFTQTLFEDTSIVNLRVPVALYDAALRYLESYLGFPIVMFPGKPGVFWYEHKTKMIGRTCAAML
jgi:hypothetical protein